MTEKDFQRIQELLTTNLSAVEGRINERIDKLEREIKDVRGEIKGVRDEIKDVRSSMEEGFDAIGAQFNEIDKRFAELDEKIDRNHQEVTKRIDTLSKDIEAQHQDALEAKGALRLLTTQHEDLAGRVAVVRVGCRRRSGTGTSIAPLDADSPASAALPYCGTGALER